ncbi:hypothetical protein AYI70_g9082 [Smittium culicis]|uniref:Uncharacterized protein n=1 Tax=Smittium culicis TaxID=133412 RepID=A0A1R1XCY8_9FUNG|nr:hypothetical protein AYI70_g9082 [Smittium culicis]
MGKDSIEIVGFLTHLFSKAKITSEPEKLKYPIKSLDPNKRRKILEARADSFEKGFETLSREEKYERLIGDHELEINADKRVIKEIDTMNTLIRRFDDLSLNLISRDREIEKMIRGPIEKPQYRSYSNYKCFNCNQYGNRINQFQAQKTDKILKKDPNLRGETVSNAPKEVNCVELELDETEIFASEKRPHTEDINLTKKKTRVLDEVAPSTDWFTKYNAVLDLKAKELVLEMPGVDVVMKLYTSKPNRRVRDEFEVFCIGIMGEEVVKEENTPTEVINSLNKFEDLFASEFSQLTQTDATENSIDTGDSQPVRQHPYRIP